MSSIHQNDELLRVQDQNYDIVFNYDKHENGGVAVHAEKDGKNHKVNPEYARAALVKKIGAGGGGWPADLPKPSVGGYGYTEQGEQTVITNESVTTVPNYNVNQGLFTTPFDIVDGAYTVIFNGTEYNLNSTFVDPIGYCLGGEAVEEGIDFSQYPFIIFSINENAVLYTEFAGDYEVTVKAPTYIIHKIDEKYLNVTETAVLSTNAERLEIQEVFKKFYSCYQDGLIPRLGIYDEVKEHIHYYDCDCAVDFHNKQNCEFHFSKTHIMIGQMQIVSIRLRRNDLEVKEHWITL